MTEEDILDRVRKEERNRVIEINVDANMKESLLVFCFKLSGIRGGNSRQCDIFRRVIKIFAEDVGGKLKGKALTRFIDLNGGILRVNLGKDGVVRFAGGWPIRLKERILDMMADDSFAGSEYFVRKEIHKELKEMNAEKLGTGVYMLGGGWKDDLIHISELYCTFGSFRIYRVGGLMSVTDNGLRNDEWYYPKMEESKDDK